MRLYKLTDKYGRTYHGTQWGESIMHTANGDLSQPLCSNAWIHAYESPEIAVLLNPIHGNFQPFRLWEAEGEIGKRDGQNKCGCRTLTTVREILEFPVFTREQQVRFAIHCAAQICRESSWRRWAERWLTGQDRSAAAAAAAHYSAASAYPVATSAAAASASAYPASYSTAIFAAAASASANILAAIEFCKSYSNELPQVQLKDRQE
jgi:hypothetical protein